MNQVNWRDLPKTAERIKEIVDMTGGGISFLTYRPAFNYNGTEQTPPGIINRDYNLVENDVRRILEGTGIKISNIKCRYDSLKGEPRGYDTCRATGLFGEVSPSGEMHSCCDRNCFKAFSIGDLTTQSLQEIYRSEKRKEVLEYANKYRCGTCPIACKPHETNRQFAKIEELRKKGEMYKVELWIEQYQQLKKPKMVNF
jgi:sulfatase maturation enzyme AslB (radical SAM superfamily)